MTTLVFVAAIEASPVASLITSWQRIQRSGERTRTSAVSTGVRWCCLKFGLGHGGGRRWEILFYSPSAPSERWVSCERTADAVFTPPHLPSVLPTQPSATLATNMAEMGEEPTFRSEIFIGFWLNVSYLNWNCIKYEINSQHFKSYDIIYIWPFDLFFDLRFDLSTGAMSWCPTFLNEKMTFLHPRLNIDLSSGSEWMNPLRWNYCAVLSDLILIWSHVSFNAALFSFHVIWMNVWELHLLLNDSFT